MKNGYVPMSDYADLYMFWPRPFPLRRGSLFRHIAYNGNRTPSAASGRMENVLLRSSNLLGVGFGLPLSLIIRYPKLLPSAGAQERTSVFPLLKKGGVMNRDLPPAVFSSYHFTSIERSDLIGPHRAGRRGRKGWVVRKQQRGRARSPPLPLPHAYLFSRPRRDAELFFF
ncbi:hypothetical protein V6N13_057115 [Hibiscus sabdariffa]